MRRALPFPLMLLVGAVPLTGCPEDEVLPPTIVAFEADQGSVDAGQTVNLNWSVMDAVGVSVWQSPGGEVFTSAQPSGTMESLPINLATTFTLTATNAEGMAVKSTVQVTVTGVNIVSFTAEPPSIARGGTTTLSWRIGGSPPSEVKLLNSRGENVVQPNTMRNGSTTVMPNETETYTLTAQAGGQPDTAEVTVTVTSQPPTVDTFEARALVGGSVQVVTTVAQGTGIQLFWTLSNADQVQISANGTVIRPFTMNGAMSGNVQTRATEPTNTYVLEACNGPMCQDITRQELVITTEALPVVDTFTVTPTEYTTGSTVATATWTTTGAAGTRLLVDGQNVPGFSRELNGSFDFDVSGEANITLRAINAVGEATSTQRIRFGYNEAEPNDTLAGAIPLPADGVAVRGTVTSTSDVDMYAVMVPEGASIFARVDPDPSGSCNALDPSLSLLDAQGTVLGTRSTAGLTRCAEILPPEFSGFAEQLTAGMYFLRVSKVGATGSQYALTVRLIQIGAPLPNVIVTRVGNPSWEVTDFVSASVPYAPPGADFGAMGPTVAEFGGTRHAPGGPNVLTTFLNPNAPSVSNYGAELNTMLAVFGYQNKTSFTGTEWGAGAMNGTIFGYTLVPAATATTGVSRDFPTGGPVILNGFFPVAINAVVSVNGMEVGPLPGDPTATGDPAAAGVSHIHVIHALGHGAFATPPPLPANVQYAINLRDNTMAGYDVVFPLMVTN